MTSYHNIRGVRRPFPMFGVYCLLCLVLCLTGMGVSPGALTSAAASEAPSSQAQLGAITLDQLGERAREEYVQARKLGTRVVELPGKSLFFAYWLPPGFDGLPEKRIMVLLHGHGGNPFRQILLMHAAARKYGFGLLALPWEWISGNKGEYRQVRPEILYVAVTRALDQMETQHKVNKRLSAWLGFSKAAQMCARFAFLDRGASNSFFQLFIAVSGQIGRRTAFSKKLFSGAYGSEPLEGKRFYLWCGEADRRVVCPGTEKSGTLLEGTGAKVVKLRKGSEGHAGFYTNPEYVQEVVKYWGIPLP